MRRTRPPGRTARRHRRPDGRGPGAANTAPQPAPPAGLDDLPALVRRAEQAGVRTALRTRSADSLPGSTALTVYRIVQESPTNVIRHAGDGAHCRVTVTGDSRGGVHIEVVDDVEAGTRPCPTGPVSRTATASWGCGNA
ncbi:hypothetical protein [Streptomyces sp. NPDC008122]|uniref:hypothetical protein n=1 Tax=Streptomyces sp. NPDC008122 TaxID=3364810 RepID=UPI0036EBF4EF